MRGIGKGMATLFGRMMKPAVTELYPAVKRQLPERARVSFAMERDESGQPRCKACMLCERSCPDNAIIIESEKRTDGPGRVLNKFTIDLGRCMFCGMCVEQCAFDGLHHTGDFELNTIERAATMLVLFEADPDALSSAPQIDDPPAEQLNEVAEETGAPAPRGGGRQ